jgi:Tfp pilus assembly protein PilN
MIRINLLPSSKRAASSSVDSQIWILVYVVGAVVAAVACGVIYFAYAGKVDEAKLRNQALSRRIEELKLSSGNLDELKAKLERSKQLEELVQKLELARLGPAKVLRELSRILSVGGGPTIDADKLEHIREQNPLAGFKADWDVRRVWITSFSEDKRECRLEGFGKSNEDVAEFLRRLTLSEIFTDVTLQKTDSRNDPETKASIIAFDLNCKVKY